MHWRFLRILETAPQKPPCNVGEPQQLSLSILHAITFRDNSGHDHFKFSMQTWIVQRRLISEVSALCTDQHIFFSASGTERRLAARHANRQSKVVGKQWISLIAAPAAAGSRLFLQYHCHVVMPCHCVVKQGCEAAKSAPSVPMQRPICNQLRTRKHWKSSQWLQGSPLTDSFNCCKLCSVDGLWVARTELEDALRGCSRMVCKDRCRG